ncbi:histidine-rich glycoprotein-like [Macrosteles quadrilineatus]|uniref:histidine-rich glycoprotein-like n=1 Tax=Macrosteles quadrilineatus TaxID=74068 RepID=UPI0023E234D0|nr:histidine-rich glycoprotein-like [Macrosteles quadrilineatus]
MFTKAILLIATVHTSSVYSSYHYNGPIAKPVVLHNGYLADTHEVAAAKNAHLAALVKQSHYGGHYGYGGSYGDNYGYGHGQEYSGSYDGHHGDIRYHGPTAIPHVLHDGHIADTHEVAAAKAEHFAAVAKAKAHGGYGDHYSGRYASDYGADHGHSYHVAPYYGPLAKPVVLKSGYLADTHEVAVAKHHHLEALHKARHYGHYDYHY